MLLQNTNRLEEDVSYCAPVHRAHPHRTKPCIRVAATCDHKNDHKNNLEMRVSGCIWSRKAWMDNMRLSCITREQGKPACIFRPFHPLFAVLVHVKIL